MLSTTMMVNHLAKLSCAVTRKRRSAAHVTGQRERADPHILAAALRALVHVSLPCSLDRLFPLPSDSLPAPHFLCAAAALRQPVPRRRAGRRNGIRFLRGGWWSLLTLLLLNRPNFLRSHRRRPIPLPSPDFRLRVREPRHDLGVVIRHVFAQRPQRLTVQLPAVIRRMK